MSQRGQRFKKDNFDGNGAGSKRADARASFSAVASSEMINVINFKSPRPATNHQPLSGSVNLIRKPAAGSTRNQDAKTRAQRTQDSLNSNSERSRPEEAVAKLASTNAMPLLSTARAAIDGNEFNIGSHYRT